MLTLSREHLFVLDAFYLLARIRLLRCTQPLGCFMRPRCGPTSGGLGAVYPVCARKLALVPTDRMSAPC